MKRNRYSVEASPLYRLSSRSRLGKMLGLSNRTLRLLSLTKDSLYSEFGIAKASGGTREIENPARQLKLTQARIARLLSRIEPGRHLFCPVKGRSYVGNAAGHLQNDHIYSLDIERFFPSVMPQRVFWFFHQVMRCERDIAGLLTAISTYKQRLPTGSPLSPILAYYCYLDMWSEIEKICTEQGYVLSIYVDDITLSAQKRIQGKDIWDIKKIIARLGLRYHKERNFVRRPAIITGCVVNAKTLLVPHSQYRKRRLLNRAVSREEDHLTRDKLKASLGGLDIQMKQILRFRHV